MYILLLLPPLIVSHHNTRHVLKAGGAQHAKGPVLARTYELAHEDLLPVAASVGPAPGLVKRLRVVACRALLWRLLVVGLSGAIL